MRFGAGFWGPFPLRQYVDWAVLAEACGFDVCWIGDTQLLTPDLYSALALAANATSTIKVGSAVTNTVTRDLTVTAAGFRAPTHARVVSDDMTRNFALAGTADDVARAIERLETCGVTHVLALMMGPNIAASLEAFGRDIIPAWRPPGAAVRSLR